MDKSIYSKDYDKLVSRLILAREASGLTQVQVAKTIQKSQSYISKIEKGQIRLDVIQLKQISEVYKKSIEFFLQD